MAVAQILESCCNGILNFILKNVLLLSLFKVKSSKDSKSDNFEAGVLKNITKNTWLGNFITKK